MNCQKWRRDISAWIDGSLPEARVERLRRHLDGCPGCARFHDEHREVTEVYRSVAQAGLEPSPFLWQRIESRLQAAQQPAADAVFSGWLEWFRIPQLRYAACAGLLLVVTGLVAVQTRGPLTVDPESLTRLDSYSLEVSGNPFLATVEGRNPFFGLDQMESGNPFELGGVAK